MISNHILDILYDLHHNKLQDLSQAWIDPPSFAKAVADKGAPLLNVWGFIDGTVRGICRPKSYQQSVFNGHKRIHALKFQSIVAPNGVIVDLFGPIEGRRHDAALLNESNLLERMDIETLHNYAVYGDPAYPLRPNLIVPFRAGALTPEQLDFNGTMSRVRESVEWAFGNILRLFAFLDFKKNLKLYLQPVGKMYIVGVLLTNCHCCLYGNQISQFFGLEPPVLEDYLG